MWIIPKNLNTYHSVQDTEELISDLSELSELCETSLMWRSKPSASKTWSRRLKGGGSIPRLSTRTLRPSHSARFVAEWISSQEASLVSHLVPRVKEAETKTQDTCGPTSCGVSETWAGLPLFSSRMLKGSLVQRSSLTNGQTQSIRPFCSMSSESWKGWVTARRREYSARVKSARPIDVSAFSSWGCAPISESQEGLLFRGCLSEGQEAQIWKTPQARDHKGPQGRARKGEVFDLPAQARGWKGPQGRAYKGEAFDLPAQVQPTPPQEAQNSTHGSHPASQWGTPTSRDHKGHYPLWIQESPDHPTRALLPDQAHMGTYKGTLNPRWVETLMGLPVGWTMPSCLNPWTIEQTSSECSETESYPAQQSAPLSSCGGKHDTDT